MLLFITIPSYSAVTTIDGLVTVDFYEDTQSGAENRWIFEILYNYNSIFLHEDEKLYFEGVLKNKAITFQNEYNFWETDYYIVDYTPTITTDNKQTLAEITQYPLIRTNTERLPHFLNLSLYMTLSKDEIPIFGNFEIDLFYETKFVSFKQETLSLYGPIGFAPVPEPISIFLFIFGAIFLRKSLINRTQ